MPPRKHAFKLRSSSLNFMLISISTVILAFTLIFSQIMLNRMKRDERDRVQNWAITTLRQADMAIRARSIFAKMETEERQYAMIWSYAYEQVFSSDVSSPGDFDYLRRIMSKMTFFPSLFIILVSKEGKFNNNISYICQTN